ncbi:flagellar sheath protein A, partial [Vibrio parahaemolyticus]|nr:flagellar sheath protein A [Vibrio parahaemolyticus]
MKQLKVLPLVAIISGLMVGCGGGGGGGGGGTPSDYVTLTFIQKVTTTTDKSA